MWSILIIINWVKDKDKCVLLQAARAHRNVRGRGTHIFSRRRFTQDLHGATPQKTELFIVTAVKASNPTLSAHRWW
jgi:hypothetical protein